MTKIQVIAQAQIGEIMQNHPSPVIIPAKGRTVKFKTWMKDLKIDPDKCCHKSKNYLLDDLEAKLGMAKIYYQYKKKKLAQMETSVNNIAGFIVKSSCSEYQMWLGMQLDEKDPAHEITNAYERWVKCEEKEIQNLKGEINTARSKHWEATGEMV
jgi:hypothetical protein